MERVSGIDFEAYEDEWEDHPVPPSTRVRARDDERDEDLPVGRILGLHKGWVDVLLDGEEIEAVYGGAMRGEQVVAGDRVRVRLPRRQSDTARIVAVVERESVLMRTGDDTLPEDERVLAANVDRAVVVVGPDDPETGARFVDRVLVAAEAGGLDAVVCLNKIDLLEPDTEPPLLERYAALGYPVVRTSALTGDGIDDLRELLAGRWSVLAGHSGVGKTSVFNRLIPGADRKIGELGRHGGRHTTVSPRAMRVPDVADAWIVDTPGVRSFGIGHIPSDDLWWTFRELRDLDCALPGCLHDAEPGCAVPDLVGVSIDAARYDSYRRFLSVLRDGG
jgi:ribosome biogenesis GTPase / thiamine phosphate phosphatase